MGHYFPFCFLLPLHKESGAEIRWLGAIRAVLAVYSYLVGRLSINRVERSVSLYTNFFDQLEIFL